MDVFSPLNFFEVIRGGERSELSRVKICPTCNATIDDILETSYVGCATCYDFFRVEFLPVITKIHGAEEHIGKGVDLL